MNKSSAYLIAVLHLSFWISPAKGPLNNYHYLHLILCELMKVFMQISDTISWINGRLPLSLNKSSAYLMTVLYGGFLETYIGVKYSTSNRQHIITKL